jgi:hypothetical protein
MIDLPKPGAYVVRTPNARIFSQVMVQHWLDSQEDTPFKSCLWLTASPQHEVHSMLEPYLKARKSALKGLDIVSIRNLWAKGHAKNGIRQLCRSLNTLCVLQPALIIIEHAELWFDDSKESLDKRNPLAHMRLLHQWTRHAKAHVITPIQGDLPEWSVFADGLLDVGPLGEVEFRPWWPTQWGLQTNLWTEPSQLVRIQTQIILDTELFSNLKVLAQACHRLRFGSTHLQGIHIQAHGELSTQDASVLLRMGADSVWFIVEKIETWLGLDSAQLQKLDPDFLSRQTPLLLTPDLFARDLHEVFMPGLLTIVSSKTFSRHGLMMLQLSKRWDLKCTITRLSLMRHMTAKTALRLANWAMATCVFTATREAIYVLKIWSEDPDEHAHRTWLESCFRENLNVLFSGDIQFIGENSQSTLLADLYEEPEPISIENLIEEDLDEPELLAELWDESPETLTLKRPWSQRMHQLLNGSTP